MRRLLCRWVEYYLALCENDIERGLPSWVRRHVQTCAHCQAELHTYHLAREAVRQYARLMPDSPPVGWRPLQVSGAVKRRAFSPQIALAPIAAVVVAVLGFVLWQRMLIPADEVSTPPQVAQGVTTPRQEAAPPDREPASPANTSSMKSSTSKQQRPKQPTSPGQSKPAPALRQLSPAYHPPKRIVIAAQPKQEEATSAVDTKPVAASPPEPVVPVQPVVVEAQPVTSAPVPEGYVIEAAYPATAGAVE